MNQYIYLIESPRQELVTNPDAWTEDEIHIAESNFAYLKQATEDGFLFLAGRSTDGEGPAIVVFEASSENDARQFMENDPFIADGLMTARLHPFRASLMRNA
jgi:uncharacterized protein YciI